MFLWVSEYTCTITSSKVPQKPIPIIAAPIVGVRTPWTTVNPIKLETGLRPNSAGIPYTLLLRIGAIGFPTFRLLL